MAITRVLDHTRLCWNSKHGMQDLNALIPANSGWELQGAVAINIAGQIVGVGTVNGQQHAFLLTPQCTP
jgi:probable HAF family extracellular repeat protein